MPIRGREKAMPVAVSSQSMRSVSENGRSTGHVATETVLLVEDATAVRLVMRETLKRAGYHVLEACNGAEALRVAETHGSRIHLLLSDVVMPDMDGPELARRVEPFHPRVLKLFISGHPSEKVSERGVDPRELDFLQKPFTRATLTDRVRQVLGA